MQSAEPVTRDAVAEHVRAALAEVLRQRGIGTPADDDMRLVGGAVLDSLGLVTLLIDLEGRLRAAYQVDVALMHERALSRRNSPFLNVATLADYALELVTVGGEPPS